MFNAPNDIFSNVNKDIYIAKKGTVNEDDNGNQIISYEKPFLLGQLNYQPLSGKDLQSYISAYGETKNKLVRAFIDLQYIDRFNEFDLAYLYGITPNGEVINGSKANYKVKTFIQQNIKIIVIFEQIIKEANNGIN